MTLDEHPNPMAQHKRDIELAQDRPRATNYVDERADSIEFWGEEIINLERDLAHAKAQYAAAERWTPPHQDVEPGDRGRAGLDIRMFDVDGDETRDQWREPESFPSHVVDVAVGELL